MKIREDQFADLANGIRLHYASAGDASREAHRPLMIFLHGFPDAWFTWEAQLTEFSADHFAVAPDLRGYNLSAKPAEVEAYRARHLVEDIRLLIEFLGYESAIVVAHDWGGAVAWNFAIMHPHSVSRLIIVNSPHPWTFMRDLMRDPAQQKASAYMNWLRAPGSEAALSKNDFKMIERFFANEEGMMPAWFTPAIRARYHAVWSVPGAIGGDGAASHPLAGGVNYYRATPLYPPTDGKAHDLPEGFRREDWMVKVPVRVVWGETDRALRPSLLEGLESVCPDLKIERIPEGSHWVVHEQPERVNATIRAFLTN